MLAARQAGERRIVVFSERSRASLQPNALAQALNERRVRGEPILDLTLSNPTHAGLPGEVLAPADPFAGVSVRSYDPEALGHIDARRAVAEQWPGGVLVDPERVVLTAGTSEAYSFLFKLLCDPGDEVLVPQPGYPLLDHLARLESVRLVAYPLCYDGAWFIDCDALRTRITRRARAIVAVNPNNPTGNYLKRSELAAIEALGLPIVSDEVFSAYPLGPDPTRVVSVLSGGCPLSFALGGLSKLVAMPQLKVSWLAVGGHPARVREALSRLELIADTYLSVATPTQLALPRLLARQGAVTSAIAERTRSCLGALHEALAGSAATVLRVEGGWYAVVRLPSTKSEVDWVLELLREDGVLVHPGWFYDFTTEPFVVLSLLTPPEAFSEGTRRLGRRLGVAR
jgi:alanine-synthesizing transaminase